MATAQHARVLVLHPTLHTLPPVFISRIRKQIKQEKGTCPESHARKQRKWFPSRTLSACSCPHATRPSAASSTGQDPAHLQFNKQKQKPVWLTHSPLMPVERKSKPSFFDNIPPKIPSLRHSGSQTVPYRQLQMRVHLKNLLHVEN